MYTKQVGYIIYKGYEIIAVEIGNTQSWKYYIYPQKGKWRIRSTRGYYSVRGTMKAAKNVVDKLEGKF